MFPGKFDFDFFLDDLKESKSKSLVNLPPLFQPLLDRRRNQQAHDEWDIYTTLEGNAYYEKGIWSLKEISMFPLCWMFEIGYWKLGYVSPWPRIKQRACSPYFCN